METRVKKKVRSNAVWVNTLNVQLSVGIDDFTYKTAVFEFGMNFLDTLFERNYPVIFEYSTDPYYWNWWLSEWERWEGELLEYVNDHQPTFNYELWVSEMLPLIHDRTTEEGFKNYLKLFKNVRL